MRASPCRPCRQPALSVRALARPVGRSVAPPVKAQVTARRLPGEQLAAVAEASRPAPAPSRHHRQKQEHQQLTICQEENATHNSFYLPTYWDATLELGRKR